MPEKAVKTHPFLQRIIANKELKYEGENLFLMGVPSFLFALNSLVVIQKILEDEHGKDGLSVMYHMLGYQSGNAAKLMKNRFGFQNPEAGMKMQQGHLDMLGAGRVDFVRMDMKNNSFILRGESTFAQEYLKTFGIQKEPVDWMIRGGAAYLLNGYLDRDDFVCVETSCIAKGAKYCEFVAKPLKDFGKADPLLKKQMPSSFKIDLMKIIEKNALGMPKRK